MFDRFETKDTMNKKLWQLLVEAKREANPTATPLNPHWRNTVKSALQIAAALEYDFIYDILYEITELKGSGYSLYANAQSLLRVVCHEVKELGYI